MDTEDSMDEDCTSANPKHLTHGSVREASMHSLLRITHLQAELAQIRASLAAKEKKVELFRRKAKEELITGKRLGLSRMSQNALSDIVTFITLLEEQIRDLRALSFIPIEIDKLKSEFSIAARKQSFDNKEDASPRLPMEIAKLRLEVAAFRKRVDEEVAARTYLEKAVVPALQQTKIELECEIRKLRAEANNKDEVSLVSFQDNEQFKHADEAPVRCFTSASPASKNDDSSPHSAITSPKHLEKAKNSLLKQRGYSPTFKRAQKARRRPKVKSQRLTPEPLRLRTCSPD